MMLTYVLFFLGATLIIFLLAVTIQLARIERTFKNIYTYTERKVKIFFETEEDIES